VCCVCFFYCIIQQLQHKNIVRYYGSFDEHSHERGTQLWIVLELAAAGDLSRFLYHCQRSSRMLSEQTIWNFFVQIASAVQHIHSKNIVHRGITLFIYFWDIFCFNFYFFVNLIQDIKPANVFVTSDLVIKLGDLGLGRFFGSKTMVAHSLVGTPYVNC
jgi:NIMA (never in mitosis gene a)-related kinase